MPTKSEKAAKMGNMMLFVEVWVWCRRGKGMALDFVSSRHGERTLPNAALSAAGRSRQAMPEKRG